MRSKKTGKIYSGCNVENAAYPSSICAERGALMQAVAAEGPSLILDEVVVATGAEEPTAPCGPCRQMMNEFGSDVNVTSVTPSGMKVTKKLDEILPMSFGPHQLKRGVKN